MNFLWKIKHFFESFKSPILFNRKELSYDMYFRYSIDL